MVAPGTGNTSTAALLILLGLTAAACACSASKPVDEPWTSGPPAAITILTDEVEVDVNVLIDGTFMGALSDWPEHTVPVPPGPRRLELRRDGFYAHRRDLQLEPGRSYTLHVRMVRYYE